MDSFNGYNDIAATAASKSSTSVEEANVSTGMNILAEAGGTGNGENGDSGDAPKDGGKPTAGGKPMKRIGAKAIEEERRRVVGHNGQNPEASTLAISIDLGIPEERVRRYLAEDKENNSPTIVVRLNKVVDHLRRRLKTATGDDLKADSPLKLGFSDNKVTISPYKR